jgi:hypothetical protein
MAVERLPAVPKGEDAEHQPRGYRLMLAQALRFSSSVPWALTEATLGALWQ